MDIYRKYLKYKKKYLDLQNRIYGGRLNIEQKELYLVEFKKLYKTPYNNNDEYFSNILKNLLEIAYNDVQQTIEMKKIKKINKMKKIEQNFSFIYKQISELISSIRIIDLVEYNLRMLQLVIILTELSFLTHPSGQVIVSKYDQLNLGSGINSKLKPNEYETLRDLIQRNAKLDEYRILVENGYLLRNIIISNGEDVYITYKNISNSCILCYVPFFSLEELVEGFIHNINYIGIVEEFTWAGGIFQSPYLYMCHHLAHFSNQDNLDILKKFKSVGIKLLDNIKTLPKDDIYSIYLILFLIIHESDKMNILLDRINNNLTFNDITTESLNFHIRDIKSWLNVHFYGGLVPKHILDINKYDKTFLVSYLEDSFNIFKRECNALFIMS